MGVITKIISPQNNQVNVPLEAEISVNCQIMSNFTSGVAIFGNIGTIVLQITLQVANDVGFSNIVWASTNSTRWYNISNDSASGWDIASAKAVSTNPYEIHKFKAPAGFLKSNVTYYCRFVLDMAAAWYNDSRADTGHRSTGIDVDTPPFAFTTIANLPNITFTSDPPQLPEFGGKVTLTWLVENSANAQQLGVFITPVLNDNLGNVASQGSAIVDVKETTQFTLEATNENGRSSFNLVVPVDAPTGILPVFNDKVPFSKTQIFDSGLKLANIGQSFDLQLYTEYMLDIRLFVAYPWASSTSPVLKINVTPPDLMKNLLDETTQTVSIVIPNPNHPESLTSNMAVSGAWGYDSKGKDGRTLRQVSGYFILMGPQ